MAFFYYLDGYPAGYLAEVLAGYLAKSVSGTTLVFSRF